jgi:hypothetical protein
VPAGQVLNGTPAPRVEDCRQQYGVFIPAIRVLIQVLMAVTSLADSGTPFSRNA